MGDSLDKAGSHDRGNAPTPTAAQLEGMQPSSNSMGTVETLGTAAAAAVVAPVNIRKTSALSDGSLTPPSIQKSPRAAIRQALPDEGGYFSPKPQHYLHSPFSTRVSRSTESSPVQIVSAWPATVDPTSKPSTEVLKHLLAGFEYPDRPGVSRDLSDASTTSTSTLVASSSDPLVLSSSSRTPPMNYPHYPNQALAALHSQDYPRYHHPYPLRTRSSHAAESGTHFTAPWPQLTTEERTHQESGSKTAGNSPITSPSLFVLARPSIKSTWDEQGSYSSPYLHWTQRQAPKETHIADIDKDPISGRKLINQYEIVDELGRGSHGKVKLARSLQTGEHVAIKIVERFSKKRRLGKLGNPEEKVKKEVAILKKAHHPNVVRLEEVIDDPTNKKVYIILEFVEHGEIKWRKRGPKEIVLIEHRRQERQARGASEDPAAIIEDEKTLREAARRRLRREKRRLQLQQRKSSGTDSEYWSIEHGGETEEEDFNEEDISRVSSAATDVVHGEVEVNPDDFKVQSHTFPPNPIDLHLKPHHPKNVDETGLPHSPLSERANPAHDADAARPLSSEGMAHLDDEAERGRGRPPSVAGSTVSQITEILENPLSDDWNYVPTLTLGEARSAFRDAVLGLEYLHFQGIIHRDIKPSNLLLDHQYRTKISDFGVSYLGKAKGEGGESEDVSESEAQQLDEATELAKTVGTPAFFAPELCSIDTPSDQPEWPVTEAIDIWALGATLFCLVFGRIPFIAESGFAVMNRIATEDIFIPRRRLKPVHLNASSRPPSRGPAVSTLDNRKRGDHELVYEDIDDELHDLLKRFFTKDPRRRITLKEVKHHPWVLQGISNPAAWLEGTDPSRQNHGKKIEVSTEDVQTAVVSMTIIERMRSGIRRLGGALGLGRRPGRNGAKNNPRSPEGPPPSSSGSSGSATSKEDRRRSLRGDESILSALKASREGEHPLSQSVTASPEAKEQEQFFNEEASNSASTLESLQRTQSRPQPPPLERAQSNISTAGSIRTIRQSDFNSLRSGMTSPPLSPGLPGTPRALDTAGGSSLGGVLGGAGRRFLKSVRSRERGFGRESDTQGTDSEDIPEIPHSEPSIAVSSAVAVGHVDPPEVLRNMSPPPSSVTSPVWSRSYSVNTPSEPVIDEPRRSITPAISSDISPTAALRYPHVGLTGVDIGSEGSIDDQFHRAQAEMLRRRNLDRVRQVEKQARERSRSAASSRPGSSGHGPPCPSSPDDDIFLQTQHAGTTSRPRSRLDDIHEAPSPTSALAPFPLLPIASSSSDERFTSDLSQSTSYPSMPSVSAVSSAPPEDGIFHLKSEDGTVSSSLEIVGPKPPQSSDDDLIDRPLSSPLAEDDEGYVGDRDRAVESEDSDSDGDDFILMTRPKSATRPVHPRPDSFSARMARRRRETGKSVRSGSGGTLKKIRSNNDDESNDNGN